MSKTAFFEEGETTGRLLARIANSEQRSPLIGSIKKADRRLVHSPDQILQTLVEFYETLYCSSSRSTPKELSNYLDGIVFPHLSVSQRKELDVPLTLDELQTAVAEFPNCKAPGGMASPWKFIKLTLRHYFPSY